MMSDLKKYSHKTLLQLCNLSNSGGLGLPKTRKPDPKRNPNQKPRAEEFRTKHTCKLKFLDAGIQDKSTSITIVDNLTERCPGTDDESDTHVEARDRRYSCLTCKL